MDCFGSDTRNAPTRLRPETFQQEGNFAARGKTVLKFSPELLRENMFKTYGRRPSAIGTCVYRKIGCKFQLKTPRTGWRWRVPHSIRTYITTLSGLLTAEFFENIASYLGHDNFRTAMQYVCHFGETTIVLPTVDHLLHEQINGHSDGLRAYVLSRPNHREKDEKKLQERLEHKTIR